MSRERETQHVMQKQDVDSRVDNGQPQASDPTGSTAPDIEAASPEIARAIRTVLRGFDERVFVRNIDGDHRPGWAIRLLPFVQALGVLEEAFGPCCLGEDCPIHGGPNPEGRS